jgi:hypothetical protein
MAEQEEEVWATTTMTSVARGLVRRRLRRRVGGVGDREEV